MAIISEIIDAISKLMGLFRAGRSDALEHRRQILERYVDPAYRLLRQVHDDYLSIYAELYARIAAGDAFSQETITWLTKARTVRQGDRSELGVLDFELRTERRIMPARPLSVSELQAHLRSFCESVRDYFTGGVELFPRVARSELFGTRFLIVLARELTTPENTVREVAAASFREHGRKATAPIELEPMADVIQIARGMLTGAPMGAVARKLHDEAPQIMSDSQREFLDRLHEITEGLRKDVEPAKVPDPERAAEYKQFWTTVLSGHVESQMRKLEDRIRAAQVEFMKVKALCV